jgi:hypothetical protein
VESQLQTDKAMNRKLLSFLFVVAVIFTVTIITGPEREGENRSLIDSLRIRAYQAERMRDKALEEARIKDIEATTWFNEAERMRKSKTVYVTKYKNEVHRIDSIAPDSAFSEFRAIYPDKR